MFSKKILAFAVVATLACGSRAFAVSVIPDPIPNAVTLDSRDADLINVDLANVGGTLPSSSTAFLTIRFYGIDAQARAADLPIDSRTVSISTLAGGKVSTVQDNVPWMEFCNLMHWTGQTLYFKALVGGPGLTLHTMWFRIQSDRTVAVELVQ